MQFLIAFKIRDSHLCCYRQYSNKYYKHWEAGVYKCVVCGVDQFSSKTKYNSGSGWPSFFDVIDKANISSRKDASGGESVIPSSPSHCLFTSRRKLAENHRRPKSYQNRDILQGVRESPRARLRGRPQADRTQILY